ncbi:MAG: hypothetical protein R2710_06515 [Acidimicrobiales bacterium]
MDAVDELALDAGVPSNVDINAMPRTKKISPDPAAVHRQPPFEAEDQEGTKPPPMANPMPDSDSAQALSFEPFDGCGGHAQESREARPDGGQQGAARNWTLFWI